MEGGGTAAEGAAVRAGAPDGGRRRMRVLGVVASVLLLGAAGVVLYYILSELDAAAVQAALASADDRQIALALVFTALSYLMLTGYDAIALRQVTSIRVSYAVTALASFTSYAISFSLGFPLITAATVRYWIYAPLGLRASAIAALTIIAGITFWLGMSVVLAGVLVLRPAGASTFTRLPVELNMLLGIGILAGIVTYLAVVRSGGRTFSIQGWRMTMPGVRITVAQMVLGALDVCAGGAVLYVLLPAGHAVPFSAVLAAYVFACILGIASHAPGGIGVFEATILLALPGIPKESLLGSLLLYRVCYYLLPFIIAVVLLGARELLLRSGLANGFSRGRQRD